MRRIVLLFLGLVLIVAVGVSIAYWPRIENEYKKATRTPEQSLMDLQQAKQFLNNSKPEEALTIIHEHSDEIDNRTDTGKEWLDLLIRASAATHDAPQLVVLYEYYPKAFDSHEKAALIVAEIYLNSGRSKDYQTLRDSWKGRETKPESWFVMDSDKFVLEGNRKEAIDFLNSRTFQGKADTARLIRLALLYGHDQPKVAWDYLTQASNKDPENPEIRSYKAKLLEIYGNKSQALLEYLTAIQLDPKNVYQREQLADFYLRNRQYSQALQVLEDNLKAPTLDSIWVKAYFWNRIATPLKFNWAKATPPAGNLEPYLKYLLDLPEGIYWDSQAFDKLEHKAEYLKTQQSTFWLRLIAALKKGSEKEAYELIQYNPFQTISWNPQLETAIQKVILYRKTGKFVQESASTLLGKQTGPTAPSLEFTTTHLLFSQIESLSKDKSDANVPADLKALLTGEEAFAALFLAAEWNEAALALHKLSVIPETYPQWVAVELTRSLNQNRGVNDALRFATAQFQSPPLAVVTGELLIASGSSDAGLEILKKYVTESDQVGYRAAWLVSLIYIERGEYDQARKVIAGQPLLADDVLGKETIARIALLQGKNDDADRLYKAIEDKSYEAKSYLARKAFADKDWNRARELTEQLLREFPTNELLQDNLKKIMEEQNRGNKK